MQLLDQWALEFVHSDSKKTSKEIQGLINYFDSIHTETAFSDTNIKNENYLQSLTNPYLAYLQGKMMIRLSTNFVSIDNHEIAKYKINTEMLSTVRTTIQQYKNKPDKITKNVIKKVPQKTDKKAVAVDHGERK